MGERAPEISVSDAALPLLAAASVLFLLTPTSFYAHNAGEYWPRRSFIKRPGVIQVRIGPPIHGDGKTAQQILDEAAEWIEGQMAEITTLKERPTTEGTENTEGN